jgi:hypothetical protein
MLDRDFEKFMAGPQPAGSDRMHVTLRKRGEIFINKNTYRMLGRPDEVVLFYSRERDMIAIGPAEGRNRPENFPLKQYQTGYRIPSGPLIRHHRLGVKETQRFCKPQVSESGFLMLNLKDTVNVPTSKGKVGRK